MTKAEEIKSLTERLCDVSQNWNEMDLVPKEQKDRCKRIGTELYALGGITLMQNTYYVAKAKNRCASVIQAYWHGIGEWRW